MEKSAAIANSVDAFSNTTDVLGFAGISDANLLTALTVLGFAISAASTVWGLVTKTTFEDENKIKRLTAAGQVSILMTIAGAALATTTFGFKTYLDRESARARQQTDLQLRIAQKAEDDRRQWEILQSQKRTAEQGNINAQRQQLLTLSQNYLILSKAAEARRLQINFADRAARAAALNLASANGALGEVRRMLSPIQFSNIRFEFNFEADTSSLKGYLNRLAEAAKRVREDPALASEYGVETFVYQERIVSLRFSSGSPLSPDPNQEPEIASAFTLPVVRIGFFRDHARAMAAIAEIKGSDLYARRHVDDASDLGFSVMAVGDMWREWVYDIDANRLRMEISGKPDTELRTQTDDIVGMRDLEASMVLVHFDVIAGGKTPELVAIRNAARLSSWNVTVTGRFFSKRNAAQRLTPDGQPIFVFDKLAETLSPSPI